MKEIVADLCDISAVGLSCRSWHRIDPRTEVKVESVKEKLHCFALVIRCVTTSPRYMLALQFLGKQWEGSAVAGAS